MRFRLAFFLSLLPLLTVSPRAAAQHSSRDLGRFNFEERELGNVEDTPMHWDKVEGKG